MIRVQVYLDEPDDRWLEDEARVLGTTKAALVREGVRLLRQHSVPPEDEPLLELIGMITDPDPDGATDVAENHDKYLIEAEFERWHRSAE